MKVYVRNDLGMRKGKIGAQVAHAVMGLWLNSMEKKENEFVMKGDNYELFKTWMLEGCNVNIIPVNSETELLDVKSKFPNQSVLITDQGRTEFKGIPTNTCLSVLESKKISLTPYTNCFNGKFELVRSKQVLVANKNLKTTKWDLAEYTAVASVKALLKNAEFKNDSLHLKVDNNGLRSWLFGAFAKIVVKADEQEMEILLKKLNSSNMLYGVLKKDQKIACVAVGADTVENVDEYTNGLKLY